MIDLSEIAGVGLGLSGENTLVFSEAMNPVVESVRQINSLSAVWMEASVQGAEDIYRVYWGAYRAAEQPAFSQYGLDHAYVVLFPGTYGCEYSKTQGHYHPPLPVSNLSTPELYKVLYGHGCFLLQHALPPYDHVDDVVLLEASAGDVFYVAPNYGHLTINLGDEPLVFEAFLSSNLTPNTEPYRARRGGAYYVVEGDRREGEAHYSVMPNLAYIELPELRRCASNDLERWEAQWGNCYRWVAEHPEEFAFLVDPAGFDPAWTL